MYLPIVRTVQAVKQRHQRLRPERHPARRQHGRVPGLAGQQEQERLPGAAHARRPPHPMHVPAIAAMAAFTTLFSNIHTWAERKCVRRLALLAWSSCDGADVAHVRDMQKRSACAHSCRYCHAIVLM